MVKLPMGSSHSWRQSYMHQADVVREQADQDRPDNGDGSNDNHGNLQRRHGRYFPYRSFGDLPGSSYPWSVTFQHPPHQHPLHKPPEEPSDKPSEKPVPKASSFHRSMRSLSSTQPVEPAHKNISRGYGESSGRERDPALGRTGFNSNGYPPVQAIEPPVLFKVSVGEESSVFSGVSSPGRAVRQNMRNFPHTQPWSESQPSFTNRPLVSPAPVTRHPLSSGNHHGNSSNQNHFDRDGSRHQNSRYFSSSRPGISAISAQWTDLYDQRRRMTQGRKRMIQLLGQMKTLRIEKNKADDAFRRMAFLYSEASQEWPRTRSLRLLENIERLQDEIISVESQVEELSEELDHREAKLESSEIAFYRQVPSPLRSGAMTGSRPSAPGEPAAALVASEGNNSRPTRPARALTNFSALSSDALLLGIKGERPDDKHPLHKLLIQTTEDLEAARDRYRGLLKECEDIKEDLRSRFQKRAERNDRASAFDLPELDNVLDEVDDYYFDLPQSAYLAYVDKVDLDFLLRYGDTIASAEAVIHAQEEHVARLQKTCRQMSILPDSISQDEEDDGSGENYELPGVDELADISSKTASDVSSFPILLSNPLFAAKQYPLTAREAVQKMLALPESDPKRQALIDDSVKEYGILSSLMRSAQGNKSDFINRWILQQLRMSPMAAVQLYSIFSGVLRIVNVSRWQEDVLHFWARDGTNLPDYYYRGPMTGLSSSFLSAMSTSSAFPDIQSLHNGVTDAINA